MICSSCFNTSDLYSNSNYKRALLAMKIVKTRLINRIDDEFLANSLTVYIEKDVASQFGIHSIVMNLTP